MTIVVTPQNLGSRLAAADERVGAGDFATAFSILTTLRSEAPGNPDILRHLGIAHALQGQYDLAVQVLVQSMNISCTWDTASALLRVFMLNNRWTDIAAFGEAAHEAFSDNPLFLSTWGASLIQTGHPTRAVQALERAMELAPGQRIIPHNLAVALSQIGRAEEAVEAFSKSASTWSQVSPPPHPATLKQAYDHLSEDYDSNKLHQIFPRRIIDCLARHSPGHDLGRVLELGCGTGLLATCLPPDVKHLVGIDQSPAMLVRARARAAYHELIEGDLVAVMETLTGPFDTVIAACVFYHFSDLMPVFAQVARLLSPEGVFVFSTDPLTDARDIGETVAGEYCHSRAYLRRLAQLNGLTELSIDIELHRGPPGFWCSFLKSGH